MHMKLRDPKETHLDLCTNCCWTDTRMPVCKLILRLVFKINLKIKIALLVQRVLSKLLAVHQHSDPSFAIHYEPFHHQGGFQLAYLHRAIICTGQSA